MVILSRDLRSWVGILWTPSRAPDHVTDPFAHRPRTDSTHPANAPEWCLDRACCPPRGSVCTPGLHLFSTGSQTPQPLDSGVYPRSGGSQIGGGSEIGGGPDVGGRGKRGIPIYILARARRPRRGKMTPFWGHSRTGSERVLTALAPDALFSGIKLASTVKSVY